MVMTIGVPREIFAGEKRVATVPEVVEKLIKLGFTVAVESGAGEAPTSATTAIAPRAPRSSAALPSCGPSPTSSSRCARRSPSEVGLMREGGTLISFIWPAQNPELMQQLAAKKATVLAMDACRASRRAQKMDALTSMANIAGYRAVIEAADAFRPLLHRPDHRRRQGAAGQGARHRRRRRRPGGDRHAAGLGAIVRAFDTRAEVADQVKSMGGEFVKVDYEEEGAGGGGYAKVMSEGFQQAQREMYAKQAQGRGHHHHHRADSPASRRPS